MSLNHIVKKSTAPILSVQTEKFYANQLVLKNEEGEDIVVSQPHTFVLNEDQEFDFNEEIYLNFPLYMKGTEILPNSKVVFKMNLMYKFLNLSPDFKFEILEGESVLYSERVGLESYPNVYNKLSDDVLLDINNISDVRFRLTKSDQSVTKIYLKKNSNYVFESL